MTGESVSPVSEVAPRQKPPYQAVFCFGCEKGPLPVRPTNGSMHVCFRFCGFIVRTARPIIQPSFDPLMQPPVPAFHYKAWRVETWADVSWYGGASKKTNPEIP